MTYWLPNGEPVATFDELTVVVGGSIPRLAARVLKEAKSWSPDIVAGALEWKTRYVRTRAGEERYNLPIGSPIGSGGQLIIPLDLPTPDPKLNKPSDFRRVTNANRSRMRAALAQSDQVYRDYQKWIDLDWADEDKDRLARDFYSKYGVDVESPYYAASFAGVVAHSEWAQWHPCRAMRRAAYEMLGFDSNSRQETTADPYLNELAIRDNHMYQEAKDADLHASILLQGIAEASAEHRSFYRGVNLHGHDPEEFIGALKANDVFDMPLASFTDNRNHADRFGTDITFVLRKGSKGVIGGWMGPDPTISEDSPDYYEEEDGETDIEYISGGRFRVVGVRSRREQTIPSEEFGNPFVRPPGYTVILQQVAVFDPKTGMLTKNAQGKAIFYLDWMFDFPLAKDPKMKTSLKTLIDETLQMTTEIKDAVGVDSPDGNLLLGVHRSSSSSNSGRTRIIQRQHRNKKRKARKVAMRLQVLGGSTTLNSYGKTGTKVIRHVRTPAGKRKFGQEIGTIIVADAPDAAGSVLGNLTSLPEEFPGYETVRAPDGRKFYIGPEDDVYVVLDEKDDELHDAPDEDAAYQWLNNHVGPAQKPSARRSRAKKVGTATRKPATRSKPSAARKTPKKAAPKKKLTIRLPEPPPFPRKAKNAQEKRGKGWENPNGFGVDQNGNRYYPVPDVTVAKKDEKGKPIKNRFGATLMDGSTAHDARRHYGIPPGWKNVRIFYEPDKGGRAAMGIDANGSTQSKYTETHHNKAKKDKYAKQKKLVPRYPRLDKVLADFDIEDEDWGAIFLMRNYGMRVGGKQSKLKPGQKGCDYQNEEGDLCQHIAGHQGKHLLVSFGATSLLGKHVVKEGTKVFLRFPGKHRVPQNIEVKDARMKQALLYQKKQAGNENELFQTNAQRTQRLMRDVMGVAITNKDLRTTVGSATAKALVKSWAKKPPTTKTEFKKMQKDVATKVSDVLGNTPTVALSSYIDPEVFEEYRQEDW